MKTTIEYDSLRPLPKGRKYLSHAAVFGSIHASDMPSHDFIVAVPLEIKNQDINYSSDFCPAYAGSEVAEDEDQVVFVPEWTFAQAKQILAVTQGQQIYDEFGLSLPDACTAAVEKGFLPRLYDPFKCDTASRPAREVLVHPENWGAHLDQYAVPYRKASFFAVDGPHDTFDNYRACLWINLPNRISIVTGCLWRASWDNATDGLVPAIYESSGSAHAFKICGQKTFPGETDPRLVAQLSDGTGFGSGGYYYFTRAQINKEFGAYGAFIFCALPQRTANLYNANGITVHDSPILKLLKLLFNKISPPCPIPS